VATVVTDARGYFAVPRLPNGVYALSAERVGFWPGTGDTYRVSRTGGIDDVQIGLSPGYLKIESADMPLYPKSPKLEGIEGTVHLEIEGDVVSRVDGASALVDAATANISTWKYRRAASGRLPVTFTYKLRSPTECATDSLDHSVLHVDGHVMVTGCR